MQIFFKNDDDCVVSYSKLRIEEYRTLWKKKAKTAAYKFINQSFVEWVWQVVLPSLLLGYKSIWHCVNSPKTISIQQVQMEDVVAYSFLRQQAQPQNFYQH